ncbi:peptidoglycan bridge formation protein FemAB [Tersicoccus solisilvae]|uniref:Peptidoglycan bridge formation protein FemAB n=1 Tax=Tersicoccus solisilvae TaxID=1882339 RepID=A0ABQ1P309_9MICC|nr:peptidoglycan bridge formation glycyltransferase FemA/FemB family protein [Tersicoccus solisilvae]GGC89771.1 peptidoglycan bridge formation protein FemAB [Tersicoccus solisilvae]
MHVTTEIISDEDFTAFAQFHPQSSFIQSAELARFQRLRGQDAELVGVRRAGELVAVAKLTYAANRLGYRTCQCSKGPLMDWADPALVESVLAALTRHASGRKAAELRISPNVRYVARDADGVEHPEVEDNRPLVDRLERLGFAHEGTAMDFVDINWMFVKSLEGIEDAEQLIMGMDYRTRKAIRKAEKNGVFLEQATLETLDEFYDALSTAGDEKGFVYRDKDYYRTLLTATSPTFTKLMMARIDIPAYRASLTERLAAERASADELRAAIEATGSAKKARRLKVVDELADSYERSLADIARYPDSIGVTTVAAIHFACYGDEITCVIGGTKQDFIYFNGATRLYWGMLLHALEHGYRRYNFYGTFGIDSEDAEGHGNYEFKKGFGGEVVQLLGTFVSPVDRVAFTAMRAGRTLVDAATTLRSRGLKAWRSRRAATSGRS